ncbi:MAG: YfhO family protein [Clostridia bacterium]|nr:YfhO family protein [Clostridia bacterium]
MTRHPLTSRSRITAAHAFFLGALLALFSLLPAIVPYGGRFVTRGDFIEQQLPFILETRRILHGGLNSFSFSTFLGAPAVGSYSFYTLGSPFVWPLALVPQALVPFGISLMAILKHAVASLTSFLYFRRVLRGDARLSLTGAVLYTFSSFTVVNTQFYHFTEVIAFFPLILLGIEIAMSDAPRPGLLSLFCGINALVNYYFMLSSALLAALYFAFRFFSEDWKHARSVRRVAVVVFECGVGCALSGVLLLPSLMHMLTITRTGAADASILLSGYSPAVLLERLRALLMPIESNVLHAYYGDAGSWCSTAAYLPAFGLTGAACFFFFQKKHRWLKALLGALLAASAVPALCGAFSLMTNTGYTRWWYGLSLLLALATLCALRDIPQRRAWLLAFAACSAAVLALTVPFLLPESLLAHLPERIGEILQNRRAGAYAPDVFRALSIGLSLLGAGVMLLLIGRRPRFALALALVCACAVLQYAGYIAAGDRHILSGGTEAGNGVYTLDEIAQPTLSALALPEADEWKRIDYGPMLRNYGLIRGSSSLTCFSSLRTSTVGRFVSMAGFGYDESTTVRPPDDQAAIRALLSVTEYHRMNEDEPLPEGFVYDREENGFSVYTNPNAVPMGFLQTTVTGTHHQRMDSGTIGSVLLASVTMDDAYLEAYGSRLEKLDVHHIPGWKESAARLRENACDTFTVRPDGFTAHIDAKEAGVVVFTIPYDKGFRAELDGEKTAIIPCDIAFMGVYVTPGEHTIEFTYRTRMLPLGIAMSLAAAAVLLVYVLMSKRTRRAHVSAARRSRK